MLFMPPWPFLLQNSCSYQPDGTKISLIHHMGRWNGTVWAWFELKTLYISKFNPKRAGLFGPISQPGGGRFRPPKISETDWLNIKCVVLVDSYDPPESIGTKKVQTYLVWRHSDVMSKTRKLAKSWFFCYFFKQKFHFLAMMCVKVCLQMFLLQINKIKHSESVSWNKKIQKTRFVCNFHWKSVFG